jgi:hypothetical protein
MLFNVFLLSKPLNLRIYSKLTRKFLLRAEHLTLVHGIKLQFRRFLIMSFAQRGEF